MYVKPYTEKALAELAGLFRREGITWFVLGGGANILVSDSGIRGAVLDITGLEGTEVQDGRFTVWAGTGMDAAAEAAYNLNLSGLEYFYGMPGSIGGAVWMNARCYGMSISDILTEAYYIDDSNDPGVCMYQVKQSDFDYKKSPFQSWKYIITRAVFMLKKSNPNEIQKRMKEYKEDRKRKGHYAYPSAGSAFKNNRAFGQPSGKIIEKTGLKGVKIGGARVSEEHANIIINAGKAKAEDIRFLIDHVRSKVYQETGFLLEPEIQFVGDWGKL